MRFSPTTGPAWSVPFSGGRNFAFFNLGFYLINNKIGSGFLENRDGGLSVFGASIQQRMEKVGMAVDVSHCGDQTTLDALDAAT